MGLKQYESNQFIKTGGTSSQYLMADGSVTTGGSGVDVGTGTANKVAKFSDSDTITASTITDDGTDVSITGKLGIDTASPDSLIHIEHEDNNYDESRGIHVDYIKDHTGTGWGASVYGVRSSVAHSGTGKTTNVQAGRFQTEHTGSGTAYFLLGSQSKGVHNGSGSTASIWGAFNAAQVIGTGTGTHPFVIGTNQKAELNNANASAGIVAGILGAAVTTAGDVTTAVYGGWLTLDCNQGATTTVDASILYLNAQLGNLTASGDIRAIHSDSTLPSLFLGTMETTSFIKTGGTSSQFLKADGSVDSNTYSTTDTQLTTEEVQDIIGAMVNGNTENNISVTYTDGDGKLNFDNNQADLAGYLLNTTDTLDGALTVTGNVTTGASLISTNAIVDNVVAKTANGNLTFKNNGGSTIAQFGNDLSSTFNGDLTADSFIKDGGTSSQFLKADGSVDSSTYLTTATIPTDFVSAQNGGSFGGGIVADSFTITGLSSGNSFLKANGSLDGTTYNSGAGTSGGVALYSGTNTITDSNRIQWNFISHTLSVQNVEVDNDLDIANDLDVTGNITGDNITGSYFIGQQVMLAANFTHTSTNAGYWNIPFNSLGESLSFGEQHYFVSPGNYRLRSIVLRNTGTASAPTITANNFRVVKNGTTLWTGTNNLFGSGDGAYSANGLSDSDATWAFGDMINFQFSPTGLWGDCAVTLVLETM